MSQCEAFQPLGLTQHRGHREDAAVATAGQEALDRVERLRELRDRGRRAGPCHGASSRLELVFL
jgi:hypothetical protein